MALACILLNQSHCVLNDRDPEIWVDVEARLRALLNTLMRSEDWEKKYSTSGYAVCER